MSKNNFEKSESTWVNHFHQWQRSGLKIREYCRQEGISHNSFYYWRKKLGQVTPEMRFGERKLNSFLPIEVTASMKPDKVHLSLPDPDWLGRFMSSLFRGLQ